MVAVNAIIIPMNINTTTTTISMKTASLADWYALHIASLNDASDHQSIIIICDM